MMEEGTGTVEKGKLADLVVVDDELLQDIKVFWDKARVKMVLKDGDVYMDRRVGAGAKVAAD